MSRSLNKVQLIGHLGADPEVRFTQDGRPIASLRIATSDAWTDKQGQRQERTEWHSVSIFGKLAEIAQQYLKKGGKVFLEGQLQTDKWTDKQGIERFTTKIVLSPFNGQMIMLDSRPGGGTPGTGYAGTSFGASQGGGAPLPAYAGSQSEPSYAGPHEYAGPQEYAGQGGPGYAGAPPQRAPVRQEQRPVAPNNFDQTPEFDDDIPF